MPDTLSSNATDVIELTRTLVRCESVTPREAGALQLLERTLAPLGFRCERMDFTQAGTDDVANLYARIGSRRAGISASPAIPTSSRWAIFPPGPSDRSRPNCPTATCSAAAPPT